MFGNKSWMKKSSNELTKIAWEAMAEENRDSLVKVPEPEREPLDIRIDVSEKLKIHLRHFNGYVHLGFSTDGVNQCPLKYAFRTAVLWEDIEFLGKIFEESGQEGLEAVGIESLKSF